MRESARERERAGYMCLRVYEIHLCRCIKHVYVQVIYVHICVRVHIYDMCIEVIYVCVYMYVHVDMRYVYVNIYIQHICPSYILYIYACGYVRMCTGVGRLFGRR